MSSHIKEIPMSIRAGVSKVAELGKQAALDARQAPRGFALGVIVGLLAAWALKMIF